MPALLPFYQYAINLLGDDYCAIAVTSTDNHTAEMQIDLSRPVGFKVVDIPLENPASGSFNAFLADNNLTNDITITNLRNCLDIDFDSIRSQSAYVNTSIKTAFDAVVNLPRVTRDQNILI